jgi:hypothetical protein
MSKLSELFESIRQQREDLDSLETKATLDCLQVYRLERFPEYRVVTVYDMESNCVKYNLTNAIFKAVPLESVTPDLLSSYSSFISHLHDQSVNHSGLPESDTVLRDLLLKQYNVEQ